MTPPAQFYLPSDRACPDKLPDIEHKTAQRVLPVHQDGGISFRGISRHLTFSLSGQTVGLTEVEDDLYEITYGPICLAYLSFRGKKPTLHTLQ